MKGREAKRSAREPFSTFPVTWEDPGLRGRRLEVGVGERMR